MKHTISALVNNRPGVLARMAEAFEAQEVNISSISCGETETPEVSRMVIRVEADDDAAVRDITEAMEAMEWVISVDDLSRKEFVDRELALVKVRSTPESMSQLMQIFEIFRAAVVGMGQETITVEITGDTGRVDGLVNMLRPFGIHSMCRTGAVALKRGDE